MALSIRDIRHVALVTFIIAALPMLVYPNSLGLDFRVNSIIYIALELIYFFAISSLLNRNKSTLPAAVTALFFFLGRLLLSSMFVLFLLVMERVVLSTALNHSFNTFKPALLLFSIASPFLYNSTLQATFPARSRTRKIPKQDKSPAVRTRVASKFPRRGDITLAPPVSSRPAGEFFERSFSDAVQHVGGYSGVICAMLVDSEGLSVAGWNRSECDQEMWGALAKEIVDNVQEISSRSGSAPLQTLEFKAGEQRFCLYRVVDMWLMSIADAASDELEKIRMHQAAEMIERHCQERFKNIYRIEIGRTYAGSTV